MSDWMVGPGWWQASDGKWYPPYAPSGEPALPAFGTHSVAESPLVTPAAGWWMASDGNWYPPQGPAPGGPPPPPSQRQLRYLPAAAPEAKRRDWFNGWVALGLVAAMAAGVFFLFFRPPGPSTLSTLSEFHTTGTAVGSTSIPSTFPSTVSAKADAMTVRVVGIGCDSGGYDHGSGWPVAPQYVVTAAHVSAGMRAMEVQAPGGQNYAAMVVAMNPTVDYSVLYVPGAHFRPFTIAPHDVTSGTVLVAGYPGLSGLTVATTTLNGSQTAKFSYPHDMVTPALSYSSPDFGPGTSGGPVLDGSGQVVAMTVEASGNTIFGVLPSRMRTGVMAAVGRTSGVTVGGCALPTT